MFMCSNKEAKEGGSPVGPGHVPLHPAQAAGGATDEV